MRELSDKEVQMVCGAGGSELLRSHIPSFTLSDLNKLPQQLAFQKQLASLNIHDTIFSEAVEGS